MNGWVEQDQITEVLNKSILPLSHTLGEIWVLGRTGTIVLMTMVLFVNYSEARPRKRSERGNFLPLGKKASS